MGKGNEESLIREILAGEVDKYEEIVRNYQNRMAGLAFRMGVHYDDIEDLAIEILTKAFRNLHLYRPMYAFSTWIYRLGINHIRDHHRRRRREAGKEPMRDDLSAGGPSALQTLETSQRNLDIQNAVNRLPERYRLPLFLLHLEEKSLEEIAGILELPTGTVKSRLHRGREQLRKILRRDFPHLEKSVGDD